MNPANRKDWARQAIAWVTNQPKPALMVRALFLLAVGALVDYGTDLKISIFAFYFVPIFIGSFLISTPAGIFLSILSAAVRVFAHYLLVGNGGFVVTLWNFVVDVVSFFIFSFLLASVREQLTRENALARHDPLTKAFNLRAFIESVEGEISRARRSKTIFTLIYLDLDNFKAVNDSCGHEAGDGLLCVVADTMNLALRQLDVVARLGGDEFAALLPQTDEKGAVIALGRLENALLDAMNRHSCSVTFSIGGITFNTAPDSFENALSRADAAMYRAKKSGKNRIFHEISSVSNSVTPPDETVALDDATSPPPRSNESLAPSESL